MCIISAMKSKKPEPIRVEYYRATQEEADELISFLEASDTVESTSRLSRKSSGLVELGIAFYVWLKPVIEVYAATKVMDIVFDQVKDWHKKQKVKKGQFITIARKGKRTKQVGKGTPRGHVANQFVLQQISQHSSVGIGFGTSFHFLPLKSILHVSVGYAPWHVVRGGDYMTLIPVGEFVQICNPI